MSLRSTLYAGTVTHRRVRPRPHRLRYRVFWTLLDLDEIADLGAGEDDDDRDDDHGGEAPEVGAQKRCHAQEQS